jgi:hypothetical protein
VDAEARLGAPPAGRTARPAGAVIAFLSREALVVLSVASFVIALVLRLPGQVNQDAWLALLAGREIVRDGLPARDTLTSWTLGQAWVDQQWLAHLAFYGLFALGGIALVCVVHALLTGGAYAAAAAAARSRGASGRAVLLLLPACFWLLIFGSWQARTQSFAYLPFVLLVWLLAADSRRPSARVFLALPLLALWANVHGSVVLAAGLVTLRGLADLRRAPLRGAALAVLPIACVFVSPYGPSLAGYYRTTLFNPAFGAMLNEWQPPALSPWTAPFFALGLLAAWLAGRRRDALTGFEQLALLATFASGLLATRSVVWFALAAIVLVPSALESVLRPARAAPGLPRLNAAIAAGSCAALAILLAATLARPASWFERPFPPRAADAVAQAAADPSARVYADAKYADWLLWRHPELRGRVAYDIRFELLPTARIVQIYNFNNPDGDPWRAPARGYPILVLDETVSRTPIRALLREPGARTLYRGRGLVALSRASETSRRR